MAEQDWPTHAAPRIAEPSFAHALIEGPRFFAGVGDIGAIWQTFLKHGLDPSFALGQFWAESLFGTAGWNVWSTPPLHSWGNILYPNSRIRNVTGVGEYRASNGYYYTYYPDWATGALDYCLLHAEYVKNSPDPQSGDTSKIYGATARWMGKTPGTAGHLEYLSVVLQRMDLYDSRAPWEGDMAIFSALVNFTSDRRYAIKAGDRWYVEVGGKLSYSFRANTSVQYMGRVLGGNWFAVKLMTGRFSSDGKSEPIIAYVPNFDVKRWS